MPNWCSTEYILLGEEKDLKEAHSFLEEEILQKPNRELSSYQRTAVALGGKTKNEDARNDIESVELEQRVDELKIHGLAFNWYMQIQTQTAWSPSHGLIDKLCEKFNLTYLFYTEEPGSDLYETNDDEGVFFYERYVVDQIGEDKMSYATIEERDELIEDLIEDEPTEDNIKAFNEEHPEKVILLFDVNVIDREELQLKEIKYWA